VAIVTDISKNLVELLNTKVAAGDFSQQFTAERKYVEEIDLAKIEGILVLVMPIAALAETLTRDSVQDDIGLGIAILKKVPSTGVEEIDPLIALVEEIQDAARAKLPTGSWIGRANPSICDPERLQKSNEFVSVLRITYRCLHTGG
jgi:hypothetical protein